MSYTRTLKKVINRAKKIEEIWQEIEKSNEMIKEKLGLTKEEQISQEFYMRLSQNQKSLIIEEMKVERKKLKKIDTLYKELSLGKGFDVPPLYEDLSIEIMEAIRNNDSPVGVKEEIIQLILQDYDTHARRSAIQEQMRKLFTNYDEFNRDDLEELSKLYLTDIENKIKEDDDLNELLIYKKIRFQILKDLL